MIWAWPPRSPTGLSCCMAGAVLTAPRHPCSRALLTAWFDLAADRARPLPVTARDPPGPAAARPGCAFAPRCGWAINLCRAVTPPLEPCDSGSEVACHRAAEVRTGVLAAAPGGPLHRCGPKPRCG